MQLCLFFVIKLAILNKNHFILRVQISTDWTVSQKNWSHPTRNFLLSPKKKKDKYSQYGYKFYLLLVLDCSSIVT